MGFWVPPPPTLSFHPQELSWAPRARREGELGAGTTLLHLWAWHCMGHECCWVMGRGRRGPFVPHWAGFILESPGGRGWSRHPL